MVEIGWALYGEIEDVVVINGESGMKVTMPMIIIIIIVLARHR